MAAQIDIEDELVDAIKNVKAPGSFAGFGKPYKPPPPSLEVKGVGVIKLPLSKTQASQLIATARQAPYGKAPRRWSIPKWVVAICSSVNSDLGIEGSTKAELYKMLIYETGAMFKPHTDTEKEPGIFGTLVISLPSPHKGSAVVVKHGGKTKTFQTSKYSESYAYWYSDVIHEVLPVTSGYHWILTYNLVHNKSKPRPTAGLQQSDLDSLYQILSRWLSMPPAQRKSKCIYHILDFDYTENSLSLQALKSHDFARAQAYSKMRSRLELDVYLALVEREVRGDCNEDDEPPRFIEEILKEDYRVITLIDFEGNVVAEVLKASEKDILKAYNLTELNNPVKEEYEGYMGNWGPTTTQWYHIGAIVLVPQDYLERFLGNNPPPPTPPDRPRIKRGQ